ncbi:MAG: SusC/RagA family TonB-linked outer membrane protein [Saprospiraceae bacterium]|nr:SusC/RagA family TonB-linked outer membrane protein [Candidatus Brachybacter algidus]MBL0119056.1 SusC/RagA family TonB-linked outer membrane protein [Candidatus Brachybacter algidus]
MVLSLHAQRTVTGRIVESGTNDGVIGASIMVYKGQGTDIKTYVPTLKGTVTDIDGKYELSLEPDENAFTITYVGFVSQTIFVTAQSTYNIGLKADTKLLEEVVVVGYGTQRKVDVTGATSSVTGAELAKQPVLTATQALQGKAAGVQIISSGEPGSSPIVRVRGVSSAIAGTATLFVVDGILTDDISNINTNDIVSMDILKDASSTAIYGARGANGVIIITTKKGASGAMTINYNTTVGYKNATDLVQMANSSEYANYVGQATGNSVTNPGFSTDWYDQILRGAWYQSHGLSLSGGSDKMTYFLSGGYIEDQGIVIDNKFRRLNLRTNLDFKINKMVKTGIITNFSNINNKTVNLGTAYNNAYRAAPIIQAKENGRYGNTSSYQNVGNPILDIENKNARSYGYRIQATGYLEVKPLDWITLRSSMGGELVSYSDKEYNYRFLNDEVTFLTAGGNQLNPKSNLSVYKENNFRWVWDNTVTFNKKIDAHTFTLLVGSTAEEYTAENIRAFRQDVPADKNLWYIGTGDANTSTNGGGGEKWTRSAYLSRLNYNFDDRFLFTGTMRYDGSSRLSKDNRWGFFPSVGAGWVLTNESFLRRELS